MRVTTKGQVTISQEIREKMGISPGSEIDLIEQEGRVYIVNKGGIPKGRRFRRLRGVATVRMTTDEIMTLTRRDCGRAPSGTISLFDILS
jgi:AbrB family looped-hinge helix DNA binding protein